MAIPIDQYLHQEVKDYIRDKYNSSNPQLSPSMSFLRVHVLSLLNYHIN